MFLVNIAVRTPFLFAAVAAALFSLAGCKSSAPSGEDQIRARIASIREAILVKRVEGVFEFGTPDWVFVGPDGKSYNKDAYRVRTTKLFSEIEIESLETEVTQVTIDDVRADVWIRQSMIRKETDANGERARWRVTYREKQEWFESRTRGWLVSRVEVVNPQREKISAP